MNRWWPVGLALLLVCGAGVGLQFWFGGIADDQAEIDAEHERRNLELLDWERRNRDRQQTLDDWSAELEAIDLAGVTRARETAAAELLDRALGIDKPVQQDVSL